MENYYQKSLILTKQISENVKAFCQINDLMAYFIEVDGVAVPIPKKFFEDLDYPVKRRVRYDFLDENYKTYSKFEEE